MRCSNHKDYVRWVCSGLFLAIALSLPVVNFGQHSWHAIQFDSGTGFAINPVQSTAPASTRSSVASLKGWGHESIGLNALHWRGAIDREVYAGQPDANQFRLDISTGLRRALNEHVETGIEVSAFQGTSWERSLRFQEEWRAFAAGSWSGRWWMALRNDGRTGRIYVEKHTWNYASNGGFDRGEFNVGAELRLPILTRVRGQVRLNKIGQRRTHHLADLVVVVHHQELQFHNWAMREGPVGNGIDVRSAASAAAGEGWQGFRLWTETEGTVRFELTEHRGLRGGVDVGFMHRVDAVRGTYNQNRTLMAVWVAGAHGAWAGKLRGTWYGVHNSGQSVYGEAGWDSYRYNHAVCEGRLERTICGDIGGFIAGGWQVWRSNALPIGWYQRSDWTAAWLRCGVVWQASTAPRWERHRSLKRRMAFE